MVGALRFRVTCALTHRRRCWQIIPRVRRMVGMDGGDLDEDSEEDEATKREAERVYCSPLCSRLRATRASHTLGSDLALAHTSAGLGRSSRRGCDTNKSCEVDWVSHRSEPFCIFPAVESV
jgi:hypothetical protein